MGSTALGWQSSGWDGAGACGAEGSESPQSSRAREPLWSQGEPSNLESAMHGYRDAVRI